MRGTLESIDLSDAVRAGAKPVVYYSAVENLDLSQYYREDEKESIITKIKADTDVWSTKVPAGGLSEVPAVAIDLSSREDGSQFLLYPEDTLKIYLYMHAPHDLDNEHPDYFKDKAGNDTDGRDHSKNAHAFNDIYMDCMQLLSGGRQNHDYIHYSYTKVGIYTKYMHVLKEWDDDDDRDGLRPGEITVKLYADGVYTGKYVVLNKDNGCCLHGFYPWL
ncbi:MAG: Cna B-type domain-containing protein [Oscillospiraceae bacterium]|nr:Cna B-type domain-containing protein [Oscillospiraceae bacterium]